MIRKNGCCAAATDFGPVVREMNEPVFHADWERRVLGMVRNIVDKRYNWGKIGRKEQPKEADPCVYGSCYPK